MARDEIAERYAALVVPNLDREQFVSIQYRLTLSPDRGYDLAGAALRLLLILTQRTLVPPSIERSMPVVPERLGGVSIASPHESTSEITIFVPLHLCSANEGITQLILNASALAEYDYSAELWLSDIQLPASILARFSGPRLGVAGIRAALGVASRPLVGMILRSRSASSFGSFILDVESALDGGVDLLVDDLLTTDPDGEFSFEPRLKAVTEVVSAFNNSRLHLPSPKGRNGLTQIRKAGYVVNIGADPFKALHYARRAHDMGAFGVMVDCFTMGYGGVAHLATRAARWPRPLAVFATNMGSAIMGRNPRDERGQLSDKVLRTGFSEALTAKLSRLIGCDAVHTGTAGSECWQPAQWNMAPKSLSSPLGFMAAAMPVAEGDLSLAVIGENIKFLHNDSILETATGITGHSNGVRSGARAFRILAEALDDSMTKYESELALMALRERYIEVSVGLADLGWLPVEIDATAEKTWLPRAERELASKTGFIRVIAKHWNP
jgi:2,3-diketo-5-methylthiopentyl-1-phosphate enolase